MIFDKLKDVSFNLSGERKVKVEESFSKRLRKFWGNILERIKNTKVMNAIQALGTKIKSIYTNDEIDDYLDKTASSEAVGKENDKPTQKRVVPPLSALGGAKLTVVDEDSPNAIPEKSAPKKEEKEPEIKNTEEEESELPVPEIVVPEADEPEPEAKEISFADEKVREILGYVAAGDEENFVRMMEKEGYRKIADLVYDNFLEGRITEKENNMFVDMRNKFYDEQGKLIESQKDTPKPSSKATTEEEVTISEGTDITDTIRENSQTIDDLLQFSTYSDYLNAYCETLDPANRNQFWKDAFDGNLPGDCLDEKTFIKEKKRQEEEIEKEELEREKAELEKELAHLREKYDEICDEHAELKIRLSNKDARLSSQRKDNVSLKQQIVDLKEEIKKTKEGISNLKNQLSIAQTAAKNAQSTLYEQRKSLAELEEERNKLLRRVDELESQLSKRTTELTEVRKELEATKKRISQNTEAALERINSLRTPTDDDIDKLALDWAEKKIKATEPKDSETSPKTTPEERQVRIDEEAERRAKKIVDEVFKAPEQKVDEQVEEVMKRINDRLEPKSTNGKHLEGTQGKPVHDAPATTPTTPTIPTTPTVPTIPTIPTTPTAPEQSPKTTPEDAALEKVMTEIHQSADEKDQAVRKEIDKLERERK